ncbi:MAG: hypothetical protein LC122_14140 [Chitinophagales bacterium]|nr:hypothetical protein [Chitinophagales bacterium]
MYKYSETQLAFINFAKKITQTELDNDSYEYLIKNIKYLDILPEDINLSIDNGCGAVYVLVPKILNYLIENNFLF